MRAPARPGIGSPGARRPTMAGRPDFSTAGHPHAMRRGGHAPSTAQASIPRPRRRKAARRSDRVEASPTRINIAATPRAGHAAPEPPPRHAASRPGPGRSPVPRGDRFAAGPANAANRPSDDHADPAGRCAGLTAPDRRRTSVIRRAAAAHRTSSDTIPGQPIATREILVDRSKSSGKLLLSAPAFVPASTRRTGLAREPRSQSPGIVQIQIQSRAATDVRAGIRHTPAAPRQGIPAPSPGGDTRPTLTKANGRSIARRRGRPDRGARGRDGRAIMDRADPGIGSPGEGADPCLASRSQTR